MNLRRLKILSLGFLLAACYPADDLSIEELDLVVTQYDKSVDFARFQTYSLPDTVVKIINGEGRIDREGPSDDLILALIRSNLENLGFVEEENPSSTPSDIVILVTAQEDDVFEDRILNDFWFFFSWWGGWFGGWNFTDDWSGVSPFLQISSNNNAGTIYIYMIDPNSATDLRVPVVWRAVVNGVISNSQADLDRRITTNLNQAFRQSSYLQTN